MKRIDFMAFLADTSLAEHNIKVDFTVDVDGTECQVSAVPSEKWYDKRYDETFETACLDDYPEIKEAFDNMVWNDLLAF